MKKLDIEKKDISLCEDNFFPSPEMELLLSIIEIKAYVDDKNINSEYEIESFCLWMRMGIMILKKL